MKLIVGQKLPIENAQNLIIDFGWRSLKSNLNLEIGAFIFDENNQAISEEIDPNNLQSPQFINKDQTGRYFEFNMADIPSNVKRIAFWGVLPSSSQHSLKDCSHFKININNDKSQKVAVMEPEFSSEAAKSAFIFEFYVHNEQWKVSYKQQIFEFNRLQALNYLDIPTIASSVTAPLKPSLETNSNSSLDSLITPTIELDALATVNLKKGQKLCLADNHSHCTSLVFNLNVVPKIDDLEFNIIALNENQKLHNIKDFLYRENTELRGDGVKLNRSNVHIKLDQIPSDIIKLQLLITRRSISKRISSADFIELSLESSLTGQSIAKFVLGTSDKNYNTMLLLDLYLTKSGWSVRAIGQGFSDGLKKVGERYDFVPPKLRSIRKQDITPTNDDRVTETVNNQDDINKQSKLQLWGLGLITLAVTFLFFKLDSFLFLPLFVIPGGLGVYLYRQSNKKIKKMKDEDNEQFVLQMIKEKDYQITAFEIAVSHKMNVEQATLILEDLCNKGFGTTNLTEQGSIYYDFTRLKGISEKNDDW